MEAPIASGTKLIRVRFYNDTPNVINLSLRQVKHVASNLQPVTNIISPRSDVIVDLLINPKAFKNEQIRNENELKVKIRNNEIESDAIGDISGMLLKKEGSVPFSINIWNLLKKYQECGNRDVRVNIMPPTPSWMGLSFLSTAPEKPNTIFLCN